MKMIEVPMMAAKTHSGMLRSEISSMSRRAFSSCVKRMNQTEVMVNQPKTCGTMRLSGKRTKSGTKWEFV